MSHSSDDQNSDSSNDFLVPADKINLNSSFFNQFVNESNLKNVPIASESSNDSEEFNYINHNTDSMKIFSQVLTNLEITKNRNFKDKNSVPSTSKIINSEDNKNHDLSKEISELLLQGENTSILFKQSNIEDKDENYKTDIKANYTVPREGIQIHLPGDNFIYNNKRKRHQDLKKLLKDKFNQRIRSSQIYIHKVGLLCWLSHGFFLNELINDPEVLKMALSLVSSNNYPKNQIDIKYITKFTKWFTKMYEICEKHKQVNYTKDLLMQRVKEKKIYNYREIILLYIATVRGMGMNCRLVISLQPPVLKPKPQQLFKFKTAQNKNQNLKMLKRKQNGQYTDEKINIKNLIYNSDININKTSKIEHKFESHLVKKKIIYDNNHKVIKISNSKNKNQTAILKKKIFENPSEAYKIKLNNKNNLKTIKNDLSHNKEYDNVTDELHLSIAKRLYLKSTETRKHENTKMNLSNNEKEIKNNVFLKRRSNSLSNYQFSSVMSNFVIDDCWKDKKPKKRLLNNTDENKSIISKIPNKENKYQKLLSSDEDNENLFKNIHNFWVEVYLESEATWISIDILSQKIQCVSDIYKNAGNPILYIVAWNSAGTLKDVTRRYCPHWLTDTRKKRVDEKWWSETLSNWKEERTEISKIEDEQLLQKELEQPLPKTITECKGHPLYVLIRHLLKFEALYPPDVVPLGHLKTGEAIYSRHCVHTLYSRETWVKRARVVKPAQIAYKIVKSVTKYDKFSGVKIKDQPLELFGKWQTTAYIPPEAKNGKVPRNKYGNVDLFKKCMLPKGTVHINLPALNRIARKLQIDCAPACVGFNFGCKGALPAFDGFVVCKEYEDILRNAWEEEKIEAQTRAKIKHEKTIYENWKKLIKGLLIRNKLFVKYNFSGKQV